MTATEPTLIDEYAKKFFKELEETLDGQFPKGKSSARGKALVLNAYANLLFRRLLQELWYDSLY